MKTMKIFRKLLGAVTAALLILSFPVREYLGVMECNIMRLIGYALLVLFVVWKKKE